MFAYVPKYLFLFYLVPVLLILGGVLAYLVSLGLDPYRVLLPAALGLGGMAAVSGILLFALGMRWARSVAQVSQGVRSLAQGDLGRRVYADSLEEIKRLAQAFNEMADNFKGMVGELSAERNKLAIILSTMKDGLLVTDREGRVVLANPAAEELLQFSVPRWRGKSFIELVRDHELLRVLETCLHTGEPQHEEIQPSGSRYFLGVTAVPLPDEEPGGALMMFHDLTQRRNVERTRREFVSNVSHELQTPISAIKAMVETLQEGAMENPKVAQDFLRRIGKEIERMAEMVGELLELSRLELGQETLNFLPTRLEDVVQEPLEGLRSYAEQKGVELALELPSDLPPILADRRRIQQLLSNLVHNAIKFTPPGGKVTLSAGVQDDKVSFRVCDTGIGIPSEHLPHIFERFYKAHRSRGDEGVGLGLAIAKHIVQAHGGEIWVESSEGEGSTFTFVIPVARPKGS